MAGPKPGGDKEALINAYQGAKSDNAPADEGSAPDPNAAPSDPTQTPDLAGDPAMKSLELQVQHLEHILVAKGIISPTDLITPPAPVPAAPPMGAPMGAPPMPMQ